MINLEALELATGFFVMYATPPQFALQQKYNVMNMMQRFQEARDIERKTIMEKQDKEIIEDTLREIGTAGNEGGEDEQKSTGI
jgi:hypothetical protein